MSKVLRPRNLLPIVLLLAMFSGVAGHAPDERAQMRTQCETVEKVRNSSDVRLNVTGNVTLNGSTVDTIDCSNFEAYSFPGPDQHSSDTSPLLLFVAFVLPAVVVVSVSEAIRRNGYFDLREIVKVFGTSVAVTGLSFIVVSVLTILLNVSRLFMIPVLVLMLAAPFLPSVVTYLRQRDLGIDEKIGSLLAFVFTSMIYWAIIIYYMTQIPVIA